MDGNGVDYTGTVGNGVENEETPITGAQEPRERSDDSDGSEEVGHRRRKQRRTSLSSSVTKRGRPSIQGPKKPQVRPYIWKKIIKLAEVSLSEDSSACIDRLGDHDIATWLETELLTLEDSQVMFPLRLLALYQANRAEISDAFKSKDFGEVKKHLESQFEAMTESQKRIADLKKINEDNAKTWDYVFGNATKLEWLCDL
ncbi:MAG: hypothetical protein Q9220_007752, partial [cf. Caloplaca sp. 1 TL-2023]